MITRKIYFTIFTLRHTHTVSEFDRVKVIVYRECELSFRDIARCNNQNPTTFMRIWIQWVPEGHTERHPGSPRPPTTGAQEDRYIVRSAYKMAQPHHGPFIW
ncbi:hypothetical protein TNCV_193801 [Trichonephila clavipes]|nr:hypothetical protein TNCV_193801 [Trichonephila clavipes]